MDLAFPTMPDFVRRMEEIVEERGYEGDVRSNVTAAVLGRLKPLSIGTKGLIFRDEREHAPGQIRRASVISQIFEAARCWNSMI